MFFVVVYFFFLNCPFHQIHFLLPATALLLLAAHLAGLRAARLSVAARRASRAAKVLERLAVGAAATEEDGVCTSGGAHSKLVEGEALTTGLLDACTGRVSEAESAHRHLGDVEEARVVDNSADNDSGLAEASLHVGVDARDGHDGAVVLALHEALQHLLVEGRGGATAQELVKLHKESEVGILAARELSLSLSLAVAVELVDGLKALKVNA